MPLVYNPEIAPQIIGRYCLTAQNYTFIDEEGVAILRQAGTSLKFEGEPDFPELWVRYGTPPN